MALSLKGYVLEPPRVGGSNAAFTPTPADLIANPGAFSAHYPAGSEPVPRTEYLALVLAEGNLADLARFGWTKNETVARFDYSGRDQRFAPLPGLPPEQAGLVGPTINTDRLQVTPPADTLADAPYRLSVGSLPGTTLATVLVSAFGSPAVGTVEILRTTGDLNWNPADLATYAGQRVRFQRQSFATYQESTGQIGAIEDTLILCPLPASGQVPLIRLGYGGWLVAVGKANDAALDPASLIPAGTVQWSATTGLLRFSSADTTAFPGATVFHDGTLFAADLALPQQALGTVAAPSVIVGLPAPGGDLIFRLPSGYQFPSVRRLAAGAPFDAGAQGEVQVKPDGSIQFSATDVANLGAQAVTLVFGDLPIERGIVLRLFRNPINLDGLDPEQKDVAALYPVEGATWADPIVGAPQVFLPSLPRDDLALAVRVEQGTGRFTGTLPRLDTASPPAGLGYILDFAARQMIFAQRKNNELVGIPEATGAVALPDPLVLVSNLDLGLETGPGTGIYAPLTVGEDALVDSLGGLVSFTTTAGTTETGGLGAFAGTSLTDAAADFLTTSQPGDYVVVETGPAAGLYQVAAVVSATQITLDVAAAAGPGVYTIRRGAEIVADRAWRRVFLVDPSLILERLTPLGPAINATAIQSYAPLDYPDAFTAEASGDFVGDGVMPGDTLVLTTGPDVGSARVILAVTATRLTVDRAFTSFTPSSGQVVRRMRLPPGTAVRLGTTFVTPTPVATDSAFTPPPAGQVQVSQETGNLNFRVADLGVPVSRVRILARGADYRITPGLGFVELVERLLAGEEMRITYRTVDQAGLPSAPITERVGFLVPKEVTAPTPRPAVTNQVAFNPTGRTVAPVPAPFVYRGGRPQSPDKVAVHLGASTITFLPASGFQTDALPSGAAVQPNERIYVDYYVYEAFGGERTFTVLQPPIYTAQVRLVDGQGFFTSPGDQTGLFPASTLLRVNGEAVYRIAGATYDGPSDTTTVTLAGGEVFADDDADPVLDVTSGVVRTAPAGLYPSYFVPEPSAWPPLPRGARTFALAGDRTRSYRTGSVVYLAPTVGTGQDFYLVTGSSYEDGQTTVTLAQPLVREARPGTSTLRVSVRPIVEEDQDRFSTLLPPVISQGYTVFRRVEGQVGGVVAVELDEAGSFEAAPLDVGEALGVFYTGYRVVPAGVRLQASYTAQVAPTAVNGLLGQRLLADFTTFSPDTFFFRVETLTNFRAEVAKEIEAAALAQAPTAGPQTSNAASPRLYEQGRPSLFYEEGHLANVDLVARALLRYFHDAINHLEDVCQSVDGRVVGATDGRFRFDGEIGNPPRTSYAQVTNEIDDTFQVSPFPVAVSWAPPAAPVTVFLGTYQPLWQPSVWSRLYPMTKKTLFGLTVAGLGTATTGQPILDFGVKNLTTSPPVVYRRWPRALITRPAFAGQTTLFVDNARGTADQLRPAFAAGMKVVITDRDGTVIVSDASALTVASALGSPERLTVGALPVDVPAGATVYLCTTGVGMDTSYAQSYRLGTDVNLDGTAGALLYIEPYFPFDGSVPLIPPELNIQAPTAGEFLQMDGAGKGATETTPFRFPALDGLGTTDTGDTGVPMAGPVPEQEAGPLGQEAALITALTASAVPPATLPNLAVDATGLNLTNTTGPWPAPVPQLYDLVKFLTGPNALVGWRRIDGLIGPNVATVDTAFPVVSSSGQAIVAAAPNVATGTATFPGSTTLNDPALSGLVLAGMTVVLTSGLNTGVRRQVVRRLSATQLLLDAPVPNLVLTSYRVHAPLNTWSALPVAEATAELGATLTNDHHLGPVVDSEVLAIQRFLDGDILDGQDGVLTDAVAPGVGTANATTLTDPGADFVAAGVTTAAYVYVATGAKRGFYRVASVAATVLTVATPFPGGSSAESYRVVVPFGVGEEALAGLFAAMVAAETAGLDANAWLVQMAPEPVTVTPPDVALFATGLTLAQVAARGVQVAARQAVLASPTLGPVAVVGQVVGSRDKLYDKRFSWIGARVNVDDGTLYEISRARARRLDAQAKLVAQLIQLASVEDAP